VEKRHLAVCPYKTFKRTLYKMQEGAPLKNRTEIVLKWGG